MAVRFNVLRGSDEGIESWAIWRVEDTARGRHFECLGVYFDPGTAQVALTVFEAEERAR